MGPGSVLFIIDIVNMNHTSCQLNGMTRYGVIVKRR